MTIHALFIFLYHQYDQQQSGKCQQRMIGLFIERGTEIYHESFLASSIFFQKYFSGQPRLVLTKSNLQGFLASDLGAGSFSMIQFVIPGIPFWACLAH
jgi:hypothetical protein